MTAETYVRRLEGSFARLLRVAALLNEEEIHAPCLDGGWTPAALVAHVAFWDDFQRRRMEAALTAAWAERIPWPEADNEARALADAERDWEAVLAEAQENRRKLVDFARSLTPEQIDAVYTEGRKERPVIRILLEHMAKHVTEHTDELWRYCRSLKRWTRAGFRDFYHRQHEDFLDAITGLTEKQCTSTPVAGTWTVRDVLAHVLTWDEYGLRVLEGWPTVDGADLQPWTEGAVDQVNAHLMAAKQEMGMIELLDGLATVHRRTLQRYDAFSPEELEQEGHIGWGEQDTVIGFLLGLAQHKALHAAELYEGTG